MEEKDREFIDAVASVCSKFVHTVPHTFIKELLAILNKHTNTKFPKDPRTLLKTPRCTEIHEMDSGKYCHYGLENAVVSFLLDIEAHKYEIRRLEIIVNIDGAPLGKFSENGLWIISCSETILKNVEVVGIYHGPEKPKDCNTLLKMFHNEINQLIENGIEYNGKKYSVQFYILNCDAPAKAYVLNVKYHTGYFSCTKCEIEGSFKKKLFFPVEENTTLRTDEGFKNEQYFHDGTHTNSYQKGRTLLADIEGFGCVTNVPLDYMHLILLGILLKMIELWMNGPAKVRLSENLRQQLSEALLSLREFMPSDFSRKPRQFKNVRRLWRAHELRQFLLYSGPVVLKEFLKEEIYKHFLLLHYACTILLNETFCSHDEYLDCAEDLLKKFVSEFVDLYGEENVSHNVHNLLHIVNDARIFGALDNFSSFRFENKIMKIKRLVRQGYNVLQQIARRASESKNYQKEVTDKNSYNLSRSGPTIQNSGKFIETYLILKFGTIVLNCTDSKNKYILLKDGTYCECKYFYKTVDMSVQICYQKMDNNGSYYEYPHSSSKLEINVVSKSMDTETYTCGVNSFLAKVCRIPSTENRFVALPLIHTFQSD